MKKFELLILVFVLVPLIAFSQEEFEMTDGDTTYTMKKYYLVLLKANPDKEPLDSANVMEIQQAHLDNINRLVGLGKIVLAGPMGDDGQLRGIFVMDCKSADEAEMLVQSDPAIQKKRLLAEIHPWWAAKGSRLP